jgi:5'-nucleotidase/UDP-sugar diphosphatase
MRRTLIFSPIVLGIVLTSCSFLSAGKEEIEQLTILHWNDFHARNTPYAVSRTDSSTGEKHSYKVGGTSNLLGYLNHLGRRKDNVLVLNAGDDFQGTSISTITRGRSQIELMNIITPDAMVLGNHEFDYGLESLRENIRLANFTIVGANLYDSLTASTFVPPTTIRTAGRARIGIIGLLPPDLRVLTLRETLTGTRLLNLDSVVTYHVNRLRNHDKVNLVVMLSHMGVDQDTLLAHRTDGIDVIIGGHSHTALYKPIKKNRTIVCQAGSWGRYIGKLDMIVDLRGDSVISYAGELIETKLGAYPIDSTAERKVRELESTVSKELDEVIGTLEVEWKTASREETALGNWEADVIRAYAQTDIGLVNSWGLRKGLPPGPITKRDVLEINPFNNELVAFSITGAQLQEMLEWQAAWKGETMQVSGLRYAFDPGRPEGSKVLEAFVGDTPINPRQTYSIVTNNYVSGHTKDLLGIDVPEESIKSLNVVDHEVLIAAIQKQQKVRSNLEGRIVNLGAKQQ